MRIMGSGLVPAGLRGLLGDSTAALGGEFCGSHFSALPTTGPTDGDEMGVSRVLRLFERGSVHVFADGLFNGSERTFGEVELAACTLGHDSMMPRTENRREYL